MARRVPWKETDLPAGAVVWGVCLTPWPLSAVLSRPFQRGVVEMALASGLVAPAASHRRSGSWG